ncbi:MAG: hypothetical protein WCA32_15690 [Chromatiaceae bacterium]
MTNFNARAQVLRLACPHSVKRNLISTTSIRIATLVSAYLLYRPT